MKYGIISDVHSNLPALEAVIDELNKRKPDKILCLGDTVGYAANPNECCKLVREISDVTVIGNHDSVIAGLTPLSLFNSVAKEACIWTVQHISPENKRWLEKLPLTRKVDNFVIAHGALSNPNKWKYVLSLEDALEEFSLNNFDKLCFIGHSHIPITFYVRAGRYNLIMDSKFKLESGCRYIINPGSVGQPRDGDPQASFGIFDTENMKMEIIRVAYDIERAQRDIIKAGLPEFLSLRLAQGR